MCALMLKTNNIFLDFVINHVLAVNYSGKTGISLIKNPRDYNEEIIQLPIEPPVALFDREKKTRFFSARGQHPCLKTTGMNIKLLSKLSSMLGRMDPSFADFTKKIKTISILETEYIMDTIQNCKLSPVEIIWTADVFFTFCTYNYDQINTRKTYFRFIDELDKNMEKLLTHINEETYTTTELACILRVLTLKNNYYNLTENDERITGIVLEILSRRSKGTGLFIDYPDFNGLLPPTGQFMILSSLISSLKYISIDHVIQDIKFILNKLYALTFKESFKSFAFGSHGIKYTCRSLGSITELCAELQKNSILNWNKTEDLKLTISQLLQFLIDSYNERFKQDINKLHNYYRLICLGKKANKLSYNKPLPIFPNRIRLTYPGPVINWKNNRTARYFDSLYLCYSLLSFAENDIGISRLQENDVLDTSMADALQILKFIFELGN